MFASNAAPAEDSNRGSPQEFGRPPCPVCGGALVPLRGHFRCSRCFFSACAGCEADHAPEPADGGD
jgi:hypothetical protein